MPGILKPKEEEDKEFMTIQGFIFLGGGGDY